MKYGPAFLFIFWFCALGSIPAQAGRANCESIKSPIKTIRDQPSVFSSSEEWERFKTREGQAYKVMAETIFAQYLARTKRPTDFQDCLAKDEWQTLSDYLPHAFIVGSLEHLRKQSTPGLFNFAGEALARIESGDVTRLNLGSPADVGTQKSLRFGGFHRGQRGLYLNPDELDLDNWFIVLIHEFSHLIDDQLKHATEESSSKYSEDRFRELLNQNPEEKLVSPFVLNGLNRGLLAEYRAWVNTAHLFNSNLSSQLGYHEVSWLTELSGGVSQRGIDLQKSIFGSLDGRFRNQTSGAYESTVARSALENLRAELRRKTPGIGSLERFLK